MVKFSKFCSESLHGEPIDVVLKCHKIFRTGNRWNRAIFTGPKN